MTEAKSDALAMIVRARDEWAAGNNDHALEILDAARVRLEGSGHTAETMPVAFGLMERIRSHLLSQVSA